MLKRPRSMALTSKQILAPKRSPRFVGRSRSRPSMVRSHCVSVSLSTHGSLIQCDLHSQLSRPIPWRLNQIS